MLHILNGDCAADVFLKTTLTGKQLIWREALMFGPVLNWTSGKRFLESRAAFLAKSHGIDQIKCFNQLVEQYEELKRFTSHEEVVLWFEFDLFCQVNLVFLLDWFARREKGSVKLSLVCMGPRADGIRGLGELPALEMEELFDGRIEVAEREYEVATKAWEGFSFTSPKQLAQLLKEDTYVLPFLEDSLVCHLARLPLLGIGLNYIEKQVLTQLNSGPYTFEELFKWFGNVAPTFGFGDVQFWQELQGLLRKENRLLTLSDRTSDFTPDCTLPNFDCDINITNRGQAALQDKSDITSNLYVDRWVGGTHLTNDNMWFWDEEGREVVKL